jgi:hypothetical protein
MEPAAIPTSASARESKQQQQQQQQQAEMAWDGMGRTDGAIANHKPDPSGIAGLHPHPMQPPLLVLLVLLLLAFRLPQSANAACTVSLGIAPYTPLARTRPPQDQDRRGLMVTTAAGSDSQPTCSPPKPHGCPMPHAPGQRHAHKRISRPSKKLS